MYNILIKGYASCAPPQPERAEHVLATIRRMGLVPSTTSICSVMDAWCELNEEEQAQRLLEASLRDGSVRLSEPLYNTLIKASSRCRCKRARGECSCDVCRCCRPDRGMQVRMPSLAATSPQLLAHHSLDSCAEVPWVRSLAISLVCMQLLHEMAARGLQPDVITVNTLIDAFCCNGELPSSAIPTTLPCPSHYPTILPSHHPLPPLTIPPSHHPLPPLPSYHPTI